MFMHNSNQDHAENVCWLVPQRRARRGPRYKSPFAAKVRWDRWAEKKGCCSTIGPPPKVLINCPEHFLKKHSRQVPVFFRPDELKVQGKKNQNNKEEDIDFRIEKGTRLPPLNTGLPSFRTGRKSNGDCEFPSPPSQMGLFRSPNEEPYEKRYKMNRPTNCNCDELLWQDLVRATECAGVMAAEMEKRDPSYRRHSSSYGIERGPMKDFIRSNAINAIRMPPRRLRRCYVDQCGVHLVDLSDAPYVLRPGFGKVPSYICRRKMELFQQDLDSKQKMNQGDTENCRVVPDMEREYVIQGLKAYWNDLLNQYNTLPLNDTGNERQREMKACLEEKMKEVEADLRLLNSTNMLMVGDVNASQYL